MEIRSSLLYGAIRNADDAKEANRAKAKEKESRLFTGMKMKGASDDAASLQIKAKAVDEYALENLNSLTSAAEDVAKAADMIQKANRQILENSDDSVLAQANQTTAAVTKLLD